MTTSDKDLIKQMKALHALEGTLDATVWQAQVDGLRAEAWLRYQHQPRIYRVSTSPKDKIFATMDAATSWAEKRAAEDADLAPESFHWVSVWYREQYKDQSTSTNYLALLATDRNNLYGGYEWKQVAELSIEPNPIRLLLYPPMDQGQVWSLHYPIRDSYHIKYVTQGEQVPYEAHFVAIQWVDAQEVGGYLLDRDQEPIGEDRQNPRFVDVKLSDILAYVGEYPDKSVFE